MITQSETALFQRRPAVQCARTALAALMMVPALAAPLGAQDAAPAAPAVEQAVPVQPAETAPAPVTQETATPAAAPAEPTPQSAPPAAAQSAPSVAPVPAVTETAPLAAPAAGDPVPVATATPQTNAAHLPRDLSPWNMFMSADIVVKGVMIGLAFASVVTWTVWLAKSLELLWARRRVVQAFKLINASGSLAEAAQRLGGKLGVVQGLIDLAAIELRLSVDAPDKAGIKERVSSRLDGLVLGAGREMNRGTGVLATIGSTSPFVGLFGTVWGIMNSFIGISEAQTTNLAIVAPGIAEALLATAIGLVAAIPAVIIYNHFARQIGAYKALIAEAAAEVMRLVSRDLDRGFRIAQARAAE